MNSFWPYLLGRVTWPRTEILAVLDSNDASVDIDLALVLPDSIDGVPLASAPKVPLPTRSAELTGHHTFPLFEGSSLMVGGSARLIHHRQGAIVVCPDVPLVDFEPDDCSLVDVLEARLGMFVQNEWYLRENLLLNLGGRVDFNSLTAQPGVSPRAALVFSPKPGQSFRLGYGRAFRKPTFNETNLAVSLDVHPDTPVDLGRKLQYLFGRVGNTGLGNEYVDALEAGFRARFLDERLSVTLDAFVARFHNRTSWYVRDLEVVPGFGGVPSFQESAEIGFYNSEHPQYGHGGELALLIRPRRGLEVSGSYALDRVHKMEEDSETGETALVLSNDWEPRHRLLGSARFALGDFRVGVDAVWFSTYLTYTPNPRSALAPQVVQEVGATTLMNGQLSYRLRSFEDRSLEAGVAVLNILDQDHREIGALMVDGSAIGGGEIFKRRFRLFVRGRF